MKLKIRLRESDSTWIVYSCFGYEMEYVFSSKSMADCYAYIKAIEEDLIIF